MKNLLDVKPRALVKAEDKKVNDYQPSRELELFCQALVSEPVKGNKAGAERLTGINKFRFDHACRTNPEFREWYLKFCFDFLISHSAVPAYALLGKIMEKDVQAIRTFYEMTGQLKHVYKNESDVVEQKIPTVVNYIAVHVNSVKDSDPNGHTDSAGVPGSIEAEQKV
jgi:hypothetical protein